MTEACVSTATNVPSDKFRSLYQRCSLHLGGQVSHIAPCLFGFAIGHFASASEKTGRSKLTCLGDTEDAGRLKRRFAATRGVVAFPDRQGRASRCSTSFRTISATFMSSAPKAHAVASPTPGRVR